MAKSEPVLNGFIDGGQLALEIGTIELLPFWWFFISSQIESADGEWCWGFVNKWNKDAEKE
jgi:hypothetical protein